MPVKWIMIWDGVPRKLRAAMSTHKQKVVSCFMGLANPLLSFINLKLMKLPEADLLAQQAKVAEDVIRALGTPVSNAQSSKAECVMFSMDRALQLDAALGSYVKNVSNPAPVHLLYRATTLPHRKAYDEVLEEYQFVIANAVVQDKRETFKAQLLGIMDGIKSEKLFFLVDDDLFVERLDLDEFVQLDTRAVIPSFRMGANLSECYTQQQPQPCPDFFCLRNAAELTAERGLPITEENRDDLLYWDWRQGRYDWAYPLSVDGHLFSTAEIRALAKHTEFHSPNTLEGNLQGYISFFKHRKGVCYRKSRMVNIPCNKVQTDNSNLHGDLHQDVLLEKWQNGLRIDYGALYGFDNNGAHQEIELAFVERSERR